MTDNKKVYGLFSEKTKRDNEKQAINSNGVS